MPTNFGSLPYPNSLFMGLNPQLIMSNAASALSNFQIPGGSGSLPFGNLSRQSPTGNNGNSKRSRTTTPMNTAASNAGSTSTSPTLANSEMQIETEDKKTESDRDSNYAVDGHDNSIEVREEISFKKGSEDTEMIDAEIPEKKIKLEESEISGEEVNKESVAVNDENN